MQKRENLDQILYEDAERRRKEQQKAKEQLDKVRDLPPGKPYHNNKSDLYVQQRFDRELKAAFDEFLQGLQAAKQGEQEHQNEIKPESVLLTFNDMINILTKMGFLPRNKAPEMFEQDLCRDLWTLVKGEENQGVSFDTLRIVMLNMIGIITKDREIKSASASGQVSAYASVAPSGEQN